MDMEKTFKNSNNQLENITLSFDVIENYGYSVINLSEPLADGIEFETLEDFKEKLISYINYNYGLYNNVTGEVIEGNYYSDRTRIANYILQVKNYLIKLL